MLKEHPEPPISASIRRTLGGVELGDVVGEPLASIHRSKPLFYRRGSRGVAT